MSKVLRDPCVLVRSNSYDLVETALDLELDARVQILILFPTCWLMLEAALLLNLNLSVKEYESNSHRDRFCGWIKKTSVCIIT